MLYVFSAFSSGGAFLVGCVGGGGGRSEGEGSVESAEAEDGVETGAGVGAWRWCLFNGSFFEACRSAM